MARERLLPFARLSFGPRYRAQPVHKLLAEKLERFFADVEAGLSPRLLVLLPPRTGKSELVSRKFPAWCLGHHPEWNIGILSYGADLSAKFSRQCRATVMSPVYQEVFGKYETEGDEEPVEIDPNSKAVTSWHIKSTKDCPQPGGVAATGRSGTLTGEGYEIIIMDDMLKDIQEARSKKTKDSVYDFYTSTMYDRLEPGGGIIVVQQRWAVDDLPGRLLADAEDPDMEDEFADKWEVLCLPAQAEAGVVDPLGRQPGEWLPARKTPEQWEKLRANIQKRDPYTWAAKFQQRPLPAEGTVFFRENFRFEDDDERDGAVYMFADTSYARRKQGDFSVIGVVRLEHKPRLTLRVLDWYRKRAQFPDLKLDAARLAWKWRPKVFVVEDEGSGKSLIQEFMRPILIPEQGIYYRVPVRAWNPQKDGDKEARAHAASVTVRQGVVALPKQAPWLKDFLDEVCTWQGEGTTPYDDQVDVLSMMCILLDIQEPAKRWEVRQIPFAVVA